MNRIRKICQGCVQNMQFNAQYILYAKNMQLHVENIQKYTKIWTEKICNQIRKICITPYFALFCIYICTPHLADDSNHGPVGSGLGFLGVPQGYLNASRVKFPLPGAE